MLFSQGIHIVTGLKSNMENRLMPLFDKIIFWKRFVIETINDELKNICDIEHSRYRSIHNFLMNLITVLGTYCLFNKSRQRWLVYALDRETKQVVAFNVGRRTNLILSVVLQKSFLSKVKIIYTDKLKKYGYLINRKIYRTIFHSNNHIGQHNLTLRTHLKQLHRKTICLH